MLPQQGVVAEVGAAFGDFTREIVSRNNPRRLHLIDAWDSPRYEGGLRQIRETFADQIAAEAIIIDRGLSVNELPKYPDGYFDWVYIDTDHSYQTTLQDLRISAAKVKRDGFIAGHDYCSGNVIRPWPYGVIEACHQFCIEEGWRYAFLTLEFHGYQSFALKARNEGRPD